MPQKKQFKCSHCASEKHNRAQCWKLIEENHSKKLSKKVSTPAAPAISMTTKSTPKVSKNSSSHPKQKHRKDTLHKTTAPGTVSTAFRDAAGITSNTSELVVTLTDYTDFNSDADESPIRSYYQSVNSNIFNIIQKDTSSPGCVFRKLVVHVLPQAVNAGVALKTFLFQGGVLAQDVDIQTSASGPKRILGSVNTVVKSDFNVQWIHVGTFDYLKIFKDSNVAPLLYQVDNSKYQELLRYAIIDPDTGNAFPDDNVLKVQFRFQLTVSYMLAPSNSIDVISHISQSWSTPSTITGDDVEETFVSVKLNGLQNSR